MQSKKIKVSKIIIFDGICMLCNHSIHILKKLDKEKIFRYTTLQGEFVKSLKRAPDVDSIILYDDGILYYKSTAILKILRSLGGMWVLVSILYIIPKFIRDFIYDQIAKNRYKTFGKMDHCRIPKEDELELFIK